MSLSVAANSALPGSLCLITSQTPKNPFSAENRQIRDYVYYSAMAFTTVGYADIFPVGPTRFIAAMEALCGLMLVGWSASGEIENEETVD